MRPYFESQGVTLYHGDAREVLPQLRSAGTVADLLLTDPPYAISAKGKSNRGPKKDRQRDLLDGDYDVGEVRSMCVAVALETLPMLSPRASVYWFAGHAVFGTIEDLYRFRGWETRPFVWWKPNAPPPMPACFPGGIEIGVHAYRQGRVWHGDGIAHHAHFAVPTFRRLSKADHPTPKPFAVVAPLITWSSSRTALVLDPFAGEGHVLLAARKLKRQAIGIELSERWCERAAMLLGQADLPFDAPKPAVDDDVCAKEQRP